MRLTTSQIEIIRQTVHQNFGADASVWLFGSWVANRITDDIRDVADKVYSRDLFGKD